MRAFVLTTFVCSLVVQILSDDKKEVKAILNSGNVTVELHCEYKLESKAKERVSFFWMKNDLPLYNFKNELINYDVRNFTIYDVLGNMTFQSKLYITVTKTFVQGYYRCAALSDGDRFILGNSTLLWLEGT